MHFSAFYELRQNRLDIIFYTFQNVIMIHTAYLVEKSITLLLSLFKSQFLMNQNDSDSDKIQDQIITKNQSRYLRT